MPVALSGAKITTHGFFETRVRSTRDPSEGGKAPLRSSGREARDRRSGITHVSLRDHGWTAQNVSVHIHDKAGPVDTSLAFLNAPELSRDAVPDWLDDLETHVNQQIHAMSSLIRGKQQQQ